MSTGRESSGNWWCLPPSEDCGRPQLSSQWLKTDAKFTQNSLDLLTTWEHWAPWVYGWLRAMFGQAWHHNPRHNHPAHCQHEWSHQHRDPEPAMMSHSPRNCAVSHLHCDIGGNDTRSELHSGQLSILYTVYRYPSCPRWMTTRGFVWTHRRCHHPMLVHIHHGHESVCNTSTVQYISKSRSIKSTKKYLKQLDSGRNWLRAQFIVPHTARFGHSHYLQNLISRRWSQDSGRCQWRKWKRVSNSTQDFMIIYNIKSKNLVHV